MSGNVLYIDLQSQLVKSQITTIKAYLHQLHLKPKDLEDCGESFTEICFALQRKNKIRPDVHNFDLLVKMFATLELHTHKDMVTAFVDKAKSSGRTKCHAEEPCQQPHIMISYQWDAQPIVLKVSDALKAAGYKLWVDVEKMMGSITGAMAKAVENSAVVLMCVSQKYKESQNCESEAKYANTLKKEIIPLRVEPGYKPDGWLGVIQSDKLYYDFTNDARFEEQIKKLVEALGDKGKLLDPADV